MKKLFALSALAFVFSAQAAKMKVIESYEVLTGDTSALIKNPVYPETKIPLSASELPRELTWPIGAAVLDEYHSESSEDGVCKLLGYEKAAAGSSRVKNLEKIEVLQINESGKIESAKLSVPMSQIICVNAVEAKPVKQIEVLSASELIHPDSGLPMAAFGSEHSSFDGVCKVLGFKKAVKESQRTSKQEEDTLQVNNEGHVTFGNRTRRLTRLVCFN